MTAPRPVTTARRAGSDEGNGISPFSGGARAGPPDRRDCSEGAGRHRVHATSAARRSRRRYGRTMAWTQPNARTRRRAARSQGSRSGWAGSWAPIPWPTTARRLAMRSRKRWPTRSRPAIRRRSRAAARRPSRTAATWSCPTPETCPESAAVPALEDDGGVVPAEADVVRQPVAHRHLAGLLEDPHVGLGVELPVVDGPGHALRGDRHHRGEGLEGAGGAHHVARHRLGGADREVLARRARAVPEDRPDRLGLALVADGRGRAVG